MLYDGPDGRNHVHLYFGLKNIMTEPNCRRLARSSRQTFGVGRTQQGTVRHIKPGSNAVIVAPHVSTMSLQTIN